MTVKSWVIRLNAFRKPPSAGEALSLNRHLFQLAWPSLIENLLQTMLGFVDLVFVGQLGAAAIAGIGLGNQLMFLLLVLFMGLSVGNQALVARAVGAGDKRDAERTAKQSLLIAAVLSLGIAAIGILFSDAIIRVLGATPEVTEIAGGFLRVVSTFSVVMGIMLVGSGTLRGSGDTRTPMVITGFINIINIVLDYLLIFGNFGFPRLGPVGSAVATTIARGVGAGLILYVLFKRGSILKLPAWGGWGFHRDAIARILNIGAPAAAEQIVFNLGFLAFSAIAILLGTNELAAQQIAFNISMFSILPAFAFGVAALTLVGQNLGAQKPDRAEQSAWQALKSGMMWMCLMGVGFYAGRHFLVRIYTDDVNVIALAEMCLVFIAVAQPLQAIAVVLSSALRGAGDTRATLVFTFVGIWIVRVAFGYLMGIVFGLGLFGVWLGWIADFLTRAVLIAWRFRGARWKTLRV
ncbi:MAG: MATE family efflux transporter [Chloroflexi bacterium]|nr:MATE family efflux transporter [Chloroflexota bacterium]